MSRNPRPSQPYWNWFEYQSILCFAFDWIEVPSHIMYQIKLLWIFSVLSIRINLMSFFTTTVVPYDEWFDFWHQNTWPNFFFLLLFSTFIRTFLLSFHFAQTTTRKHNDCSIANDKGKLIFYCYNVHLDSVKLLISIEPYKTVSFFSNWLCFSVTFISSIVNLCFSFSLWQRIGSHCILWI